MHGRPIRIAMAKFLLFLLMLALAAASNGGAAAATLDDDADLQQRREYMAEIVRFGAHPETAAAVDPKTISRLDSFLKSEMGPIETIFGAIRRMPENSAAEVRTKDDAFDAAMELLDRKFRVLFPHARAEDDVGFAIRRMPENSADEVRAKEEARAVAKQLTRDLGSLFPGSSVKIIGDW